MPSLAPTLSRGPDEARNDNEYERATALRQANALMDRHGVQIADLDGDELGPRGQSGLRTGSTLWKSVAVTGIARLYGCKAYRTTGGEGEVFVVGRQHYRNVVLDMSRFVIDSIERESGRHTTYGRRFTSAFRKGAATGINANVGAIIAQRARGETVASQSQALVLVEHYAHELGLNAAWLADQDIQLRAQRSTYSDRDGYAAGRDFGQGIGLSDQLGGAAGPRRALTRG